MEATQVEREGAVAVVRLNRPDRLNAMSDVMLDELLATLEGFAEDEALGALVLTGNGRAFCAGGDLSSMSEGLDGIPQERMVTSLRRQVRITELLRTVSAVTIAAVNGPCAGAGLGLAAACDLRYAADTAVFRVAFLGAAMSGDFGTAWLLSRLLGEARARELYFLDEKVRADEALRIGLVSRVFPVGDLLKEVGGIAEHIAAAAPLARRGIKANLNAAGAQSLADALREESVRHVACAYSEDAAEAGAAFLERRQPVYRGR